MSQIGFYVYVPDADVRADLIRFLLDVDGLCLSDISWGNCVSYIRYIRCWVTRRFKFCADASSDYFYAIGCSGPDDSWYVCADSISGEFIPLIDYLDALNEMFDGADAAFVDWRPIL